jgi:lysozyme
VLTCCELSEVALFSPILSDDMRCLTILIFLFAPVWGVESNGLLFEAPEVLVQGLDVSHHQKMIEWDTVLAHEKVEFAFVKATEGSNFTDSMYCYNWESLQRLGVRRGAYHFFRPNSCGYEQACHFLETVEMAEGDMAPVLDAEVLDGVSPDMMVEEMHIWLTIIQNTLGIVPIIYTNQHFYDRFLAGRGFDEYPLWIARYSYDRPILQDGRKWDFWQCANDGCVDGISKRVDLNIFPGTLEMLDERCWKPLPSVALP